MKLILMRHAEAVPGQDDFSRPLSPKGQNDAIKAARSFHAAGWLVDELLSSPLVRAQETRKILTKNLKELRSTASVFREETEELLKPGFSWADARHILERRAVNCSIWIFHAPDIAHLTSSFTGMPVRNCYFSPGSMIALNAGAKLQGKSAQIWQSQPDYLPNP